MKKPIIPRKKINVNAVDGRIEPRGESKGVKDDSEEGSRGVAWKRIKTHSYIAISQGSGKNLGGGVHPQDRRLSVPPGEVAWGEGRRGAVDKAKGRESSVWLVASCRSIESPSVDRIKAISGGIGEKERVGRLMESSSSTHQKGKTRQGRPPRGAAQSARGED